jgi:hypothetical protein
VKIHYRFPEYCFTTVAAKDQLKMKTSAASGPLGAAVVPSGGGLAVSSGGYAVAVDVVCVAGEFTLEASEWYIKFFNVPYSVDISDLERVGMRRPNNKDVVDKVTREDRQSNLHLRKFLWASIYVNSTLCDGVYLFVGPENKMYFYDAETLYFYTQPTADMLRSMNLNFGQNIVVVKLVAVEIAVDFELWLYKSTDRIVVMDIDGTITKSGVPSNYRSILLCYNYLVTSQMYEDILKLYLEVYTPIFTKELPCSHHFWKESKI